MSSVTNDLGLKIAIYRGSASPNGAMQSSCKSSFKTSPQARGGRAVTPSIACVRLDDAAWTIHLSWCSELVGGLGCGSWVATERGRTRSSRPPACPASGETGRGASPRPPPEARTARTSCPPRHPSRSSANPSPQPAMRRSLSCPGGRSHRFFPRAPESQANERFQVPKRRWALQRESISFQVRDPSIHDGNRLRRRREWSPCVFAGNGTKTQRRQGLLTTADFPAPSLLTWWNPGRPTTQS